MKQRLSVLLISVLLFGILIPKAWASESLIIDNGALLSSEERTDLESQAQLLSDQYRMDVVILTVSTLDGKAPQDYADDYYDYHGYGQGNEYDGFLFLLSLEERDWYISTSGSAMYVLTDYGIQQVAETVLPYLSDGEYYEAFCVYLDTLPVYLDAYQDGSPLDGDGDYSGVYSHGAQEEILYFEVTREPSLLASLVVGLAAAAVTVFIMQRSMDTRRKQTSANSYLQAGSFHLNLHRDIFLYSSITKTKRPEPSSGGGSSVHRSSSCRRHGGGGGKF